MVQVVAGLSVEKILISACLLGQRVRYDGYVSASKHALLKTWQSEGRLVPFCPEVAGGLTVPRPAAEIQHGNGDDVLSHRTKVATRQGADLSSAFLSGARQALALCSTNDIRIAILKENSPSCGVHEIHDGSFSGHLHAGHGVTAALLKQSGLSVFNEHELQHVAHLLEDAECRVP